MKKLVFSKERFIEIEGMKRYESCKVWVDECDGKTSLECYPYGILDKWLVEVDDEALPSFSEQLKEYQPKHAKEMINHPSHYQIHKHECIQEMIAIFGIEDTKTFCKLNIWKYRYRSSAKNGEEDLKKADEYMDILMELQGETK